MGLSKYDTEHRELEQPKNIPAAVRDLVLQRDNHQCQLCGTGGENRLQLHHVQYRSLGGTHTTENLVTLCFRCHEDVHQGRIDVVVIHYEDDTWATFPSRRYR